MEHLPRRQHVQLGDQRAHVVHDLVIPLRASGAVNRPGGLSIYYVQILGCPKILCNHQGINGGKWLVQGLAMHAANTLHLKLPISSNFMIH